MALWQKNEEMFMGQITTDQSHQVMATFAGNTDWDNIDFETSQLQELVIRNPKEAGRQFGAFLKNGGRVIVNVKAFQVWKTLKLGIHRDVKSLKKAIEENGRVSDWASDIMTKPEFIMASQETMVDLVNVSVADLGLTKATPLRDIYARAIELGLSLCPAEVGPQLRLQYPDQPNGEWLRVAMEAITASDGRPDVFDVERGDGERWLDASWGYPDREWSPGSHFVFVLRK